MKKIITIQITKEQADWLENAKFETGESISSQVRRCLQSKMKAKRGGK